MWLEELSRPMAWVSLEKSDNNTQQFLTYVLTALGQKVVGLGQRAMEMIQSAQEVDLQHALA